MGETESLVDEEFALLRSCMSAIADPRQRRGRVHPLEGVLSLSVLGLMTHCRSLSDIHRFGELHPEALRELELRRSPSVPTLGRVLRGVSVAEVREALRTFAQQLLEVRNLEKEMTVAADGKSCRGGVGRRPPARVGAPVCPRGPSGPGPGVDSLPCG